MFVQLVFLLAIPCNLVYGLHNVTVDDQSPLITYSPPSSWILSNPNDLDAGGAHTLTQDKAATATFTFTGIVLRLLKVSRMVDSQPQALLSISCPHYGLT